jgi:RecA/RadA recombinase
MHYEKTNAKTKTTINEVGVNVQDATGSSSKSLLFAGYVDDENTQFEAYRNQTIVGTDNIVVREFLVIGENSRIQDYEDGGGIFIL